MSADLAWSDRLQKAYVVTLATITLISISTVFFRVPAAIGPDLVGTVGLLVNSLNADVMNFRFLWLAVAWMSSPADDRSPHAG